jgi:hypothetical protein
MTTTTVRGQARTSRPRVGELESHQYANAVQKNLEAVAAIFTEAASYCKQARAKGQLVTEYFDALNAVIENLLRRGYQQEDLEELKEVGYDLAIEAGHAAMRAESAPISKGQKHEARAVAPLLQFMGRQEAE